MPDVSRSDSQRSDSSQRPRVSFNRDVRIKRIGNVDGEGQGQGEGQGEGHRRQRGHGSRSQSAREAAIVNIPVMDTSHRKSTIPKRNTKDIVNQNRINDTSRKKLTRSVSDAGSRYTHDRNKYGPGKSYWSENEGEEDSASSEGGRQKLRKQEEKKINIFATLNNRLRGKKKKNNVDSNRSRAEDLRPTTPTRRTDTGIEVVPNFKTEKSKSKSIENLLPEIGAHQQKKSGQLTQTSTLPRRSKNSKKQLSPIIEDEPIASNSRRSPFDFNDQDRRMNSVQDDLNLNSAPKIIIEPPTPIQEVEEKIFTTSKRRSDQALKRDNEINLNLLNFSGRDSRSSMRGEEHDGHKSVEKNDRGRLSSIRDYRKNELEKIEDKKPFVGRVYDLSTRTIRNDNKTRIKPKAETKSRSKFYDNEEWFSSEEDFSLAHDNGHYKSYDYGLLDPDLSLTISDEVDGRKKKVEEGKQIEVVDDSKKNASKIESLPPKTYSKEGKDLGTILMKEGLGKNKKSTNDEDGEEERLTNERRDRVKRTSSVNMNADGRSTMGDDERRDSLDNSRPKIKQEGYFKSGSNSQKEPGKNIEGRNSLSRRFFEKERRGSLQGLGDKFDIHNETETSTRKLVTSDEEEKMSRKTVGMLVQELSRKQNAKKRKENFQADKTKSGGPLIDPLLDVDRQHNNNKPFSYTDPYKSPPPLQPTDAEVIYAQVICCRPAVGGHEAAGLAANTEFRVSLEPSVELATSDRIQQPSSQKNSGSRRAASNAAVKVYEKAELDDSDHTTTNNSNLPGKQSNNGFIIATNVSQNYRKTKKGSPVDLNRTIDNNSNNYNNFSSNISNNESRKTLERKLVDYNNPSISEINSTVEYANESQQIKSERVRKKDRLNKDSSEVFSETLGNDSTVNSEKKVITRKEFLVDDYSFSPIVEETREASSFGENKRYHQSSPSLYFSKSERDLSNLDNFSQEIQKEEGGGKRESIIRIDVEKDNIAYHQDYFDSKSQKMNTTHSASTEKLLSGDIHDLSLRRHRLESIIDSHKRRFENRAISPNRYSRTLTRSVSNVSPSHRNSNRLIEDDLSSATKKTIKEDRYFERHIKRTASNFKDKDLLSDSAPLKIESDDSYRTNRNGRNNYKTYNYYLKNDSKNNEKFNNEYNLTNSIRDNKYRSSDNVADIYQHNEESNNEINGTKYGKKHFREWYTSTSVKKTERGSGDDSYGYGYDGSLKGEEGGERFTDEGRNIRADGKYPTRTLPTPSSDDGKDNRKGKGSGRGGFFEKLSTPRKVSGLEKVRRKLSNWNSAKKNSSQDKVEKKDKKKKKGKEEKVHEEEPKDPLTSRYSEYRGEESAAEEDHTARESDYYATRQRVSTPETDPTWFRSLDRIKHKSSHSRLSGEDTVDRKHRPVSRANSTSQKNLRFFGESDSGSYPSLNTSHLQVPSNRTSSRLRSSLDSSAESTLEDDSGHSQKSVVYLHAATVGDIPGSRKLHRSQITSGRRSMSREELSSNKTDSTFVPHKRTLSRSISVLAPWRPRHPRDGIDVNYNDAGKPPRAPIKISNRTLTKLQQQENKRRPVSSAGADRRGSDQSTSTAAASGVSISSRRRDETDLARSKSVPRSSKLSSGWFRAK